MAVMVAAIAWPQLRINGKDVAHNDMGNTFLCSVPEAQFGQDFTAIISAGAEGLWTNLRIDGEPVEWGGAHTFSHLDGTTTHRLQAIVADSTVTATLQFTFLPILEIHDEGISATYSKARFALSEPDSAQVQLLQGRVKLRGHTTLMAGRHKRNYHIKLEDNDGNKLDRKLLGMRSDNSWMLDGGQVDLSRIRNVTAHQLWLDMAAKPYYADREPKARTAVRSQMIELFVNGEYLGIYALTEALDRKQMKLKKYDEENGILHGQLWRSDEYTNTTTLNAVVPMDNISNSWGGFVTKYPDTDEVPPNYQRLYDAVYFISSCYDGVLRRQGHLWFDLPVVRDYQIFVQVLLAIDNTSKNMYWACYDSQTEQMLTPAVWDLDCTVGQDWTNVPFRPEERVGPDREYKIGNGLFFRLFLLVDDYHESVIERYHELRGGILQQDSLIARYTQAITRLQKAGAAARESQRWSGDSDLGGQELDFEKEKEYIKQWLTRRLYHLDNYTFARSAVDDVKADDLAAAESRIVYDLLGRPHSTENLAPGIYVRAGKKFIVK